MEHLGLVKEASWSKLADHPGIGPPHEALQLREGPTAHGVLNKNWDALAKSCKTCHAQYRNVPHEEK